MISAGSRFFFVKYLSESESKVSAIFSRGKSLLHRELHIGSANSPPVKLAYASYGSALKKTSNNAEAPPIIITHGFLGSKSGWDSLSKEIHQRTNREVIAVDARNHGDSPHTSTSTYEDYVGDIILLIKDLEIEKAVMIGHSMGGRAMTYVALEYPEVVEKLVVIDNSPVSNSARIATTQTLFDAMKNLKFDDSLSSLSEARKISDQRLSTSIKTAVIRQYLLSNLVEAEPGRYKWSFNLAILEQAFVESIVRLPPTNKTFDGPTLFIGGSRSDHIIVNDHAKIKQLFPAASIQYIQGAGHWVHTEKRKEFLDMLIPFINETQ